MSDLTSEHVLAPEPAPVDNRPRNRPGGRGASSPKPVKPIRTRVVVAALIAVALCVAAATIAVGRSTQLFDGADQVQASATSSTTTLARPGELPPAGVATTLAPTDPAVDGGAAPPAVPGAAGGGVPQAAVPGAALPVGAPSGGGSGAPAPGTGTGPASPAPVATTAVPAPAPTSPSSPAAFPAGEGCDTGGWDLAVCRVGSRIRLVTAPAVAASCLAQSATSVRCGAAGTASVLRADASSAGGVRISYAPAHHACRIGPDRIVCQVLSGAGERDPYPASATFTAWATGASSIEAAVPEGCTAASPSFTCGGVDVAVDRSTVRVALDNLAGVACGAASAGGKLVIRCGDA